MVELCTRGTMMENAIPASVLNDFVFCPMSIYFHRLYAERENRSFQVTDQINGTSAHLNVDNGEYSTSKHIITSLDAYSEEYNVTCKIDIFDTKNGTLTERKKMVHQLFDGFIYQIYAQYFSLKELGYDVKRLRIHSMDDNKNYDIKLPEEDPDMLFKFRKLINKIQEFDVNSFSQNNSKKCKHCIYEPACDRSLEENVEC